MQAITLKAKKNNMKAIINTTNKSKAFKVIYDKAIGGIGSIIVRSPNEYGAIKCASDLCFTGKNFRNAIEVPLETYTKPNKQGFQG